MKMLMLTRISGGTVYVNAQANDDEGYVYDGLEQLKKWMGGDDVDPSER